VTICRKERRGNWQREDGPGRADAHRQPLSLPLRPATCQIWLRRRQSPESKKKRMSPGRADETCKAARGSRDPYAIFEGGDAVGGVKLFLSPCVCVLCVLCVCVCCADDVVSPFPFLKFP
jgi:hypothetical protein